MNPKAFVLTVAGASLALITLIVLALILTSTLSRTTSRLGPTVTPLPSLFLAPVPHIADGKNLTQDYESQYGPDQRTNKNKQLFAQNQLLVLTLPPVNDARIVPGDTTPAAVKTYVEKAVRLDLLADKKGVATALQQILATGDVTLLRTIRELWVSYQQSLAALPVPPSAVTLQRMLLGYTEAMIVTFDQIMAVDTDTVKSLTAMYQLEVLDRLYYPQIMALVQQLSSS